MYKLYHVFDIVAECIIGPLMQEKRDAPAIRAFTDALKDPNTLGRHAEDYELRYLGDLDEAGTITIPAGCPVTIMTGNAWKTLQQLQIPPNPTEATRQEAFDAISRRVNPNA